MGTDHFNYLGTHGRIILKQNLIYCGDMCLEIMWVKAGAASCEVPSITPGV
jgi:hypothetical protein